MFESDALPRSSPARHVRGDVGAYATAEDGSLELLWERKMTDQEVVRWLVRLPLSAAAMQHLDAVDVNALNAHDRVSALALWDRYRSWLDAQVQRAMLAVAGPGPAGPAPVLPGGSDRPDDVGREEVAAALGISSGSAAVRLRVARELHAR
ncbi:MAG: hypothetical protein ABIM89_16895, partial [Mycobacteriales bacterium]